MREWESQAHVRWYCRYHVVFIPKDRKKAIFGRLRKEIGGVFRELCDRFGLELVEGHALPDHVHMCLSIPPKFSVSNAIGKLKKIPREDQDFDGLSLLVLPGFPWVTALRHSWDRGPSRRRRVTGQSAPSYAA